MWMEGRVVAEQRGTRFASRGERDSVGKGDCRNAVGIVGSEQGAQYERIFVQCESDRDKSAINERTMRDAGRIAIWRDATTLWSSVDLRLYRIALWLDTHNLFGS